MHRLGIQWVDLFWEWRLRQVFYIPFLNLEHKFMQQPPWNSLSDFFLGDPFLTTTFSLFE